MLFPDALAKNFPFLKLIKPLKWKGESHGEILTSHPHSQSFPRRNLCTEPILKSTDPRDYETEGEQLRAWQHFDVHAVGTAPSGLGAFQGRVLVR